MAKVMKEPKAKHLSKSIAGQFPMPAVEALPMDRAASTFGDAGVRPEYEMVPNSVSPGLAGYNG